ncbi:hypothetical protein V1505DRAFT_45902 [Lipomyces doorenjongii]
MFGDSFAVGYQCRCVLPSKSTDFYHHCSLRQRRQCQKPLSGLSGFYRPLITLAQGLMESISTILAVNTPTKTRPFTTYGQSKLGDVLCASEYANLVSDKGILSLSLNPGNLKSNLQRHYGFIVRQVGTHVPISAPTRWPDRVICRICTRASCK